MPKAPKYCIKCFRGVEAKNIKKLFADDSVQQTWHKDPVRVLFKYCPNCGRKLK